jgi:transposase-like protein
MRYKKRDPKEKARIVLEYLTTHNTAEICNKYGIHQNQLYRWRDEFLSNAHKVFEVNGITKKEQKLLREIQKLKSIIGELTLELKKRKTKYIKEEKTYENNNSR